MSLLVSKLLSNPHTTGSGGAFVAIKAAQHIALLWAPQHYADSIKGTAEALETLAVAYGLIMAGDAGKGEKALQEAKQDVAEAIKSGNTENLVRKDLPASTDALKVGL